MSRPSWLVDSRRIAKKIKSASEKCDPKSVNWKSNPSRACPNCNHIIDNSDVNHEWPGLPGGVKFDPTDQEIIWHLHAKVGSGNVKPHPFIEEFIPTVNEEDGICYTHPQRLPGVTQDGSVSHFFHRAIKAYNTGTRKRRKIHGDDLGDVRWHKTGRTKPVISDGIQMGCKKIMVLYMSTANSKKPEKTNWVMHQYHLGTGEDEQDGEFVLSKVFYQQQAKISDKLEQDISCDTTEAPVTTEAPITKVDPVTPKSVIPEPPRRERWQSDVEIGQELESCVLQTSVQNHVTMSLDEVPAEGTLDHHSNAVQENDTVGDHDTTGQENDSVGDHEDIVEDPKVLAGESQFVFDSQQFDLFNSQQFELLNSQQFELLNSQQLIEGLSLGDELLQSQPSGGERDESKALLSDYSRLGVEAFKKDIEECQKLDPLELFPNSRAKEILRASVNDCGKGAEDSNQNLEEFRSMNQLDQLNNAIDDTPPEFRLSQLEFNSQESFAWAGSRFSE